MQLRHIELAKLAVSPANMRAGRKAPDVSDLIPSVRARGILVPLLVRPNGDPDHYEIVAGRRRYHAALAVAAERGLAGDAEDPACRQGAEGMEAAADAQDARRVRDAEAETRRVDQAGSGERAGSGSVRTLPCAIIEAGDDAAALEASLIENVAREDGHEVEQWETFTRLVKEGRSPDDLAVTLGLTGHQVRQVLSLGNLNPRIRRLYRNDEIDPATIRLLTLASPSQQKDWLALLADPDTFTPTGTQLRAWLFGGAAIATKVALFDLAAYPGEIVTDLFGDGGFFADAGQFWEAQDAAIEAKRQAYLDAGWSEVMILPPGEYFRSWDYEKVPRTKGGKVVIDVTQRGEVTVHKGLLKRRDAERLRRAGDAGGTATTKPARPEVTATLQSYIDLHRHAVVRTALLDHPGMALRLLVAHAIAGSHLFSVRPEPQRGATITITESVETSPAETAFDAKRRAVLALLGFDPDAPTVVGGAPFGSGYGTADVFARLLALTDEDLLGVIAVVIGESLEAGSAAVEFAGLHLGVDMANCWQADDTFFELLRDKEVLTGMVAELGGDAVARGVAGEKAKGLKAVIRDCLGGTNGRAKVDGWVPRWMRFAPTAYTERGGVGSVERYRQIAGLLAPEVEMEASDDGGEGVDALPPEPASDPLALAADALIEAAHALASRSDESASAEAAGLAEAA